RYVRRHLSLLQLFHNIQVGAHFCNVKGGPSIIAGEFGAGLVFARKETTRERDAREDSEIIAFRLRKYLFFGTAIQTIVNHLEAFGSNAFGFARLKFTSFTKD